MKRLLRFSQDFDHDLLFPYSSDTIVTKTRYVEIEKLWIFIVINCYTAQNMSYFIYRHLNILIKVYVYIIWQLEQGNGSEVWHTDYWLMLWCMYTDYVCQFHTSQFAQVW